MDHTIEAQALAAGSKIIWLSIPHEVIAKSAVYTHSGQDLVTLVLQEDELCPLPYQFPAERMFKLAE